MERKDIQDQMKKGLLTVFILTLILSGCSLFSPRKQQVDYASLELTAIFEITGTAAARPTSTPTFTPLPTNTPEPTATDTPIPTPTDEELLITRQDEDEGLLIVRADSPTETPTAVPPTATVYFPDKAEFVYSLPSPNQFVPNQRFYMTWQLKNTGTSTWSGKYRFYYSEGIHLADQDSYEITETVSPGGTLTVTMPATAPDAEGTYRTTWVLENSDGIQFYWVNFNAIVGDRTFITEVPELSVSATPASLEWMCSDPDRSLIQGDGCTEYCVGEVIREMEENGMHCYANGEVVSDDE